MIIGSVSEGLKAQSAVEYLMTYGWMLLVVAIAGGAIFSVVQGQGIESVSGFTGTEIAIDDFGMNSEDELTLAMRNTAADKIKVKAVELEDPETGATNRILPEKEIDVGNAETVEVDGFETISSSNEQGLRVIYDTGSLNNQVVEGTITGNLKAKNHVYLQNAVFNRSTDTLNITAQNTGNTEANVDYTINSDSNSFNGDLGTLSSGETKSFTVNADETFSFQNVSLDVNGQHFSNSQKRLKCTPTKGLVGYWTFNQEETQNGYTRDRSQYSNDGKLKNFDFNDDSGWEYGIERDLALKFDGEDDYVELENTGRFIGSMDKFSVSFWARWDSLNFWSRIVDFGSSGGNNGAFLIANNGNGNDLTAEIRNSEGQSLGKCTVANGIDVGSLDYWTVTWENESQKIYKNGEIVQSCSYTGSWKDIQEPNKYLGRSNWASDGYFRGNLDEFRLYNGSLSQKEIQRLYQVRSQDWAVDACKLAN